MAQSRVDVIDIPSKISREHVQQSLIYFLACKGISDLITEIKYIGGCSNHALRVTTQCSEGVTKNWLVRLPGSYSEILVNRQAEKFNTAIVAKLSICPAFEKHFLEEGNVLQQQGYKVEDYLENAESLTPENFHEFRSKALSQLKKVHQCGQVFQSHYHLLERIKMMCYTLQNVGGNEITQLFYDHGKKAVTLKKILEDISKHEEIFRTFKATLVPCHNDLTPYNFMKINGCVDQEIYILDWEYSGMNDPMCDLAYIANESGLHSRETIKDLLLNYYEGMVIPEYELQKQIDRVLFYSPMIDLKVAIWSLLQVNLCNQSQYIDDLRSGWGPERYKNYLEKVSSAEFLDLVSQLEEKPCSVSSISMFNR